MKSRCASLLLLCLFILSAWPQSELLAQDRWLYVFRAPRDANGFRTLQPSIEIYDIDAGHKFHRVVPLTVPSGTPGVKNIQGAIVDVHNRKIYISHFGSDNGTTPGWLLCLDLLTEQPIWHRALTKSVDRGALSADGAALYIPDGNDFNTAYWHVIDPLSGAYKTNSVSKVTFNPFTHNTLSSLDGSRIFMQAQGQVDKSGSNPSLTHTNGFVTDAHRRLLIYNRASNTKKYVGPFQERTSAFTINGRGTFVFATVNDLLGFQVADANTGKVLHTAKVSGTYAQPSVTANANFTHGIAITGDEKEVWIVDSKNRGVHAFVATNLTKTTPKWVKFLKTKSGAETNSSGAFRYGEKLIGGQPGWISSSYSGDFLYPETGEIINVAQKKVAGQLVGSNGKYTHSRYMIEVVSTNGIPILAGDPTGTGRVIPSTGKPAKPSLLSGEALSSTQVRITWKDNSSVESLYNVYRSTDGVQFAHWKTLGSNTTNFVDSGLLELNTYHYKVRAFNGKGHSDESNTATVTTPGDTSPPTTPTNLRLQSRTDVSVTMRWDLSTDNKKVTQYYIYRNGMQAGTSSDGLHTVNNLHPSTSYSFTVIAGDAAGNLSQPSVPLVISTLPSTSAIPPAPPHGMGAASPEKTRIDLIWTDASNVEDGFHVYRSSDDGVFTIVGTVGAGSMGFSDVTVNYGQWYVYKLASYNGAGESESAEQVRIKAGAGVILTSAEAPADLVATPVSATRIDIQWNDRSSREDGFRIYRAVEDGPFEHLANVGESVTSFADAGLQPLTTYRYQVLGYTFADVSPFTNIASAKTLADTTPPTIPGDLQQDPHTDVAVRIFWSESQDDVGVTGYQIFRNGLLHAELPPSNEYTDSFLHPNTHYQFEVRAIDAAGNKSVAATLSFQSLPSSSPVPPEAPSVVYGTGSGITTLDTISFIWADNSITEDGFEIESSEDLLNFQSVGFVGAGVTNYTSSNHVMNTTTHFRIRAFNGAGPSPWSDTKPYKTKDDPALRVPVRVIGFTTSGSSTNGVLLTWSDTANETGFRLEQSEDGGTNYSVLADLPADSFRFLVQGLQPAREYHYRIAAYNALGSGQYAFDSAKTDSLPPEIIPSYHLTLVTNREPRSVILVQGWSNAAQQRAASELQQGIELATGVKLDVAPATVSTNYPSSWVRVRIGDSTMAANHGVKSSLLSTEEYRIKTIPGNIFIVGKNTTISSNPNDNHRESQAMMWGCTYLLDRYVGIRWLWPGAVGTHAPSLDHVLIPNLDIKTRPIMEMRQLQGRFGDLTTITNGMPVILTPQEQDGVVKEVREWGERNYLGRRNSFNTGHSFEHWYEKYFATRPDFFAVQPPGTPGVEPDRIHLNLGNPDVSLAILQEWREAGSPTRYSVNPNDGKNYCTSPESRAMDFSPYQNPREIWLGRANVTRRYVTHWNHLLTEMRKEKPGVVLNTLVYSAYKFPPEPDNMPIPGGFVFLTIPGYYQPEIWKGWAKAQNPMMIRPNWWHTGISSPHMTHYRSGNYFRMAQQNGMMAFYFDELNGYWAVQGLNYYMMARLAARPDLSVDDVVNEYVSAFGSAAPQIRQYLDYWERYAERQQAPVGSGGTVSQNPHGLWETLCRANNFDVHPLGASAKLIPHLYKEDMIQPALDILDQADLAAANDPEIVRQRIQFLRGGMLHLRLLREVLELGYAVKRGQSDKQALWEQKDLELRALRKDLTFQHVVWADNAYNTEQRRAAPTLYWVPPPPPPPPPPEPPVEPPPEPPTEPPPEPPPAT